MPSDNSIDSTDPVARPPSLRRRPELLRDGYTANEVRSAVRSGELVRFYAGCYWEPPEPGAHDRRAVAVMRIHALALRSPSLIVSHVSAAILHGLPVVHFDPQEVHFIRPAASGARQGQGRIVHPAAVGQADVVVVAGVVVTSLPRTLIDLACTSDFATSVAAVDAALHSGRLEAHELAAAIEGIGRRVGIGRARNVVRFADGRSESPGESVLRVALHRLGLPRPDLQVVIRDGRDQFVGRADLVLRDHAVILEFDGMVKYTSLRRAGESVTDVVLAEKRREERLTAAGFVVVRVVWSDLRHDDDLGRRIRMAMARGQRALDAGAIAGRMEGTR